ncbi:MAG TPA: aminoglycoside phosphotransferase family protein [Polyangiaceae bacterium]|nr:aminoglycoside phosphotransferase family protein [Polyangiaceae bacterium]
MLEQTGALRSGRVSALEMDVSGSSWSQIIKLTVGYSNDAVGDCPRRLLVKICTGAHAVFGQREVEYYRRDYARDPLAPVPRCYAAAFDAASGDYSLALEDLSATHAGDLPVTEAYATAVADALARLHARYWGSRRLATIGEAPAASEALDRYFAHVERGFQPLCEVMSKSPRPEWSEWREALGEIFAFLPNTMRERARVESGMTLVHGDLNPGNLLSPRSGMGQVYLIDRHPFDRSLRCWLGVSDLAYVMVLFWSPEQRIGLQQLMLRRYQSRLRDLGIKYDWAQLWWDYRLCVAQCAVHAVEWLVLPEDREKRRELWTIQLERSMAAFFELECREL